MCIICMIVLQMQVDVLLSLGALLYTTDLIVIVHAVIYVCCAYALCMHAHAYVLMAVLP